MDTEKIIFRTSKDVKVTDLSKQARKWCDSHPNAKVSTGAYGVAVNGDDPRRFDQTLTLVYTEKG